MIRVLIVDDDDSIRELLAHKFNSGLNVEVTEASSGNEAIAILKRGEKFCLIVSDYNMEDGSGFDLLSFVTAAELRTLFIFFTSELDPKLPPTNRFFLGTISKLDPTALIREAILGICMAPAYFRNLHSKTYTLKHSHRREVGPLCKIQSNSHVKNSLRVSPQRLK